MLPELIDDSLLQYVVHARAEILQNLRLMVDRHVQATVYFNRGADFVVTRMLGINPGFEELLFDPAQDNRTNDKLLAAGELTVVAFFNHIKLQFTVNCAEMTSFQRAPAFRVRTPGSILRLQRRNAFRARTLISNSPGLLLPAQSDQGVEIAAGPLRIVDISATGFAFIAPADRPLLTAGMRLPRCSFDLIASEGFDVDIEIRHVSAVNDGAGWKMCRAGCCLLRISGTAQMAIQRYVHRLAVSRRDGNDSDR